MTALGPRVAVIAYGHVADSLAATPALRALREANPAAVLDLYVLSAVAPLFQGCPYVDRVVPWQDLQHKGGRLERVEKVALAASLGRQLRRRAYDAVVIMHRSTREIRLAAHLSGAPVRAGLSEGGEGMTHTHPLSAARGSSHEHNRLVLAALGVAGVSAETELWVDGADSRWAGRLLEGRARPLVGIHAGSDWSCQEWLPARWGAVAERLVREAGATIVLSGSAEDLDLEAEVARTLGPAAVRTSGTTTLGQLGALLQRLDLLLCVNSAAAAMARALGTRAVVLMGNESRRFTGLDHGGEQEVLVMQREGGKESWCEFGRWGRLSGCHAVMCRGLGGLQRLEADEVAAVALAALAPGEMLAGMAQ